MEKIVFVRFKSTPFGGAENYLSRLLQALKERAIPYDTFSTGSFQGDERSLPPLTLPSHLPKWLQHYLFARAFRAWRANNPEATTFSLERVFGADIYRAGDGVHRRWLEIKREGSPLQALSILLNPLHWLYLKLEKSLFQNTQLIIANSEMIKREITHYYPIDESKIRVIYNGIPLPDNLHKERAKKSLAKEMDFAPSTRVILYVGSGFERKGVKEALEMLAGLREKNDQFRAIFIGKEKRLKRYERLAQRLGIAPHCHFLGARQDVARFLEAGDIFLFPTRYEPFSNACLEAMAYGNALLTTKRNGIAEILPEGIRALETPHDIEAGIAALKAWLDDPALLHACQESCQRRAQDFTIQANLTQTLEAIHEHCH